MAETLISVYGGMFDSTEVVETVGGFPRGNKAVDSEFFAKMLACFWADGIFGEDSYRVTAGEGLSVNVAPGIAWARGYMAWQKEAVNLPLSAGVSYTVVLRLNTAAGEFALVLSDSADYIPQKTDSLRELVFASISVPDGAASVSEADITDRRLDSAVCGVVTSTVDALGSVENAQNAGSLGGFPADAYLKKEGGTMTGALTASADGTGSCVVRNIGYGEELPDSLGEGELFVLI